MHYVFDTNQHRLCLILILLLGSIHLYVQKKLSIIFTDKKLGDSNLSENFNHVVINDKENEYVRFGLKTNNVKNFWSLLKPGIFGIYHQVSPRNLHRYCNDLAYRFNARKMTDNNRFDLSLKSVENCHISCKELINK